MNQLKYGNNKKIWINSQYSSWNDLCFLAFNTFLFQLSIMCFIYLFFVTCSFKSTQLQLNPYHTKHCQTCIPGISLESADASEALPDKSTDLASLPEQLVSSEYLRELLLQTKQNSKSETLRSRSNQLSRMIYVKIS